MTLSIICAFIGCWTPYFVVHLIHIWTEYQYVIAESVYAFAETLALLNSAINPILYGCFNVQLKRSLTELCCPGSVASPSTHRPVTTSPSHNGRSIRAGRETFRMSSLRAPLSSAQGVDPSKDGPRRGTSLQRRQLFQTTETNFDNDVKDDVRLRVKFADRKERSACEQAPGSTGVCLVDPQSL